MYLQILRDRNLSIGWLLKVGTMPRTWYVGQEYTQSMSSSNESGKLQDEVLELGAGVAPAQIEARKLQIGFWDKLVILDAGTLALSINAATAFRGHTVGDGGVGFLFAAWKLLVVSIIFACLAQWLGSISAQHLPVASTGKLIADRRVRLRIIGADIFDGTPEETRSQSIRYFRIDKITWLLAVFFGTLALALMIFALIYLCRFGSVNLSRFL